MLEFDISDPAEKSSRIGSDLLLHPTAAAGKRELLVSTILDSSAAPGGVIENIADANQILFAAPREGKQVAWRQAERVGPASFWMLAYLTSEQIEAFVQNQAITQDAALRMKPIPEDSECCMVIRLPRDGSLHLDRWVGTGHMPGFHLLAVAGVVPRIKRFSAPTNLPKSSARKLIGSAGVPIGYWMSPSSR